MMTKMTRNLKAKYNSARIITEEDWAQLDAMLQKVTKINSKEEYLKKNISIDKYIKMDIEDFELLAKEHSALLSIVIDLEDILGAVLNGDTEVFPTAVEAKDQLKKTIEKITELRAENNEYFKGDF